MPTKSFFAVALFLLFAPFGARADAALQISEVMYDPDGTDAGREWVEIFNDGSSPVDLSEIFLLEANVKHKISAPLDGASLVLGAGSWALIADKADLFSADYPNVSPVFDSVFSLSNSGERLALVDADGDEYSFAEWGAGSGATSSKSWQRLGLTFVAAAATPGAANADREDPPSVPGAASSSPSTISAHSGTRGVTTVRRESSMMVDAGRARVVPAGAELSIDPALEGSPRASFLWAWGDGAESKGRRGRHTYRFPGTYAVVLNARGLGGAVATSRTVVTALAVQVAVSVTRDGPDLAVLIESQASQEINLGGFTLEAGGESFVLPKDTILLPRGSLAVPNDLARLPVDAGEAVVLRRPDGRALGPST